MDKKIYLVELINRCASHDDELKDIYEVSISDGFAVYDKEYESWEDFERSDYISERFFLSSSKDEFVFGKEITESEFDELGGFDEYEFADWHIEEYIEGEDEANKYAEELINDLKNGKYN